VAAASDKLSIIQLGNDGKCMADFVSLESKKKGYEIGWRGQLSGQSNSCGRDAIKDLSSSTAMNSYCELKGFRALISRLEAMGFESGLTYQAVPYDWRYSVQQS
jgi:hypothetical protein